MLLRQMQLFDVALEAFSEGGRLRAHFGASGAPALPRGGRPGGLLRLPTRSPFFGLLLRSELRLPGASEADHPIEDQSSGSRVHRVFDEVTLPKKLEALFRRRVRQSGFDPRV